MFGLTFAMLTALMAGADPSAHEFSRSMHEHGMASGHSPHEVALVVLGVVVVIVTTAFAVLYLIRPGEAGEDHIKRRILEDDRQGLR